MLSTLDSIQPGESFYGKQPEERIRRSLRNLFFLSESVEAIARQLKKLQRSDVRRKLVREL